MPTVVAQRTQCYAVSSLQYTALTASPGWFTGPD